VPDTATPHELTPEELRFAPPELDEETVADFVERHWGLRGALRRLAGERDQNFRLRLDDGRQFVIKIASPLEDPALVDYQVRALLHVARRDRGLPTPRIVPATDDRAVCEYSSPTGETHAVRLLSWVAGKPLGSMPALPLGAVHATGQLQGRLCRAFADFAHPAQRHFMPWDALNGLVESPALRHGYLPESLQERCAPILERLEHESLPRMRSLPAQVIHNDAHRGNIMCDPDDASVITGVIDFGDLAFRPVVTDLATSLTSFTGHSHDPLLIAGTLVSGFRSVLAIDDAQLALLYDALLTRAILTVQLLTYRVRHAGAPESVRTVDLAESVVNLKVALSMDPDRFLAAVSA
jgi:Ser/Thr protein kinase RdoA (MazF antagonist)